MPTLPTSEVLNTSPILHLILGDDPSMSNEAFQHYLKDTFKQLSDRRDLKELTINFVSKEAEDSFFSSISAEDWCQLIDHNYLNYCVLTRLYALEDHARSRFIEAGHICFMGGYPLSQNHSSYLKKHTQQVHGCRYMVEYRRKRNAPKIIDIEALFDGENADKVHEALFRSLMFQFVFDENERSQMADQPPEIVNEFLMNKLFNQLQEHYENHRERDVYLIWKKNTRGESFINDNEIALNELPTNMLLTLFDKVVENHSYALDNWCSELARDNPARSLNANLDRAIKKQLLANKEVPLRKVILIVRDGEQLNLLCELSTLRRGKGTIEAYYIDDITRPDDYLEKLQEIIENQKNTKTSLNLVYDLKVRFQIKNTSQEEINLLLQIRENAAARLRKRAVRDHQLQSVAPASNQEIGRVVSSAPIPYIAVVNGTKKRQKDRLHNKKLKIQQQIQAQVSEQAVHQQVSLTQVNQRLMALQSRQQQVQQQAVVPIETGKLLRRDEVDSYWFNQTRYYLSLPVETAQEALHLWDAVTATVTQGKII